jgi:hypothetical protein
MIVISSQIIVSLLLRCAKSPVMVTTNKSHSRTPILVQTVPLYTRDVVDDPLWYFPADFSSFKQRDRYIEEHMENPSIVTRIRVQSEMGD